MVQSYICEFCCATLLQGPHIDVVAVESMHLSKVYQYDPKIVYCLCLVAVALERLYPNALIEDIRILRHKARGTDTGPLTT